MAQRSGQFEDKRQLLGLAQRRAFATYLRFGPLHENAPGSTECKAVDQSLSAPAPKTRKATRYYVWRSAGDNRVRDIHAARDGRIFTWSDAPPGGHPGTEPSCRCWPEPYYGDPAVPDALQPLTYSYQTDTTGTAPWASIETLTRPDGSVAQSVVISRDGTQFRSQFVGTQVSRRVALAMGQTVRIDTSAGVQSIYRGDDQQPLFQSAWTARGPRVISGRQHIAFRVDDDHSIDALGRRRPEELTGGAGGGGSSIGLSAVTSGLTALYAMLQAVPANLGLSAGDEPVLAITAWSLDGEERPVPILVGSLNEEQLRQHCRFLPDVQNWTDAAAALLAEQKPVLSARTWGSLVHGAIKRTIDALKKSIPFIYDNLHPEISFYRDRPGTAPYGQTGSTRLDIVEDRRREFGAVCDYDIKTGREGLTLKRLKQIAERLANNYPGAIFYLIEVRPRP